MNRKRHKHDRIAASIKVNFFRNIFIYSLLQKNLSKDGLSEKHISKDEPSKYKGIRCPLCKWQPNDSSLWFCSDCDFPEFYKGGCGTAWNTFETHGKCPGCQHIWRWTTCLSCGEWSKHKDWYAKD